MSTALSPALANRGSMGIASSLSLYLTKKELLFSKVDRVTINILFMPYKQEGDLQKCYHKIKSESTYTYYRGMTSDDIERIVADIHEKVAHHFQVTDQIGHNAYHQIDLAAEVECVEQGIVGKLKISCDGSFNRESRINLLGTSNQYRSLVLEGLDIDEPAPFIPRSTDERRKFLIMP